ncbi:MAG: DNA polymerase ligase N-terminal domain-containing protein [Patescibacteria group bacterium]|jgi:DNA ligase D-like protein (predicted 3'-phosphoesterase)
MALEKYQKKRKFSKTPEPKAQAKIKSQSRFVVQKHSASHLHYDFRLELPDKIIKGPVVLKSWAVPKGIPTIAGVKHLAVAVEDHPVAYINFAGVIPKGNYGAGLVEILDKGKFKLLEHTSKSLKFELKGKKLRGVYVLTQFTAQKKNWLVFKVKK